MIFPVILRQLHLQIQKRLLEQSEEEAQPCWYEELASIEECFNVVALLQKEFNKVLHRGTYTVKDRDTQHAMENATSTHHMAQSG